MNCYKILDNYINEYKKDSINTLCNMKNYYDNEDDYWFVIEELLDKIKETEDLQQRIDKAIDYIDKCRFNEVLIDMGSEYTYETDYFKDNIISILKGEDE